MNKSSQIVLGIDNGVYRPALVLVPLALWKMEHLLTKLFVSFRIRGQ